MDEFDERDVQVIGASVDSREDNAAFAEKESFNFPLVCDRTRELSLTYGAVEDRQGIAKRISYLIGPDGTIEKVYPDVDPKTHPAEVLADVDALKS